MGSLSMYYVYGEDFRNDWFHPVSSVYHSHILHNYLKQNYAQEKKQFSGAVSNA